MSAFRLGLTGSIGMGKSTTAAFFAAEGIPVWDADSAVHRLYAPGGAAVAPLGTAFPMAVHEGAISREALKRAIAADPTALRRIEAIVHPLVAADRAAFLSRAEADLVVLDIPLLFETGAEAQMDATLVVTAPAASLQRARVLARPGMTEALFETILAKQMPDGEKRKRATHVIETLGMEAVQACVRALIAYVRETMREIVLDTETTGFEPGEGHRIVEIGAVELFNHMPTGRTFHQYINPLRAMPKEAFEVHGLGDDFLRDKPVFKASGRPFSIS
jgi:dephospho-CoA kinase